MSFMANEIAYVVESLTHRRQQTFYQSGRKPNLVAKSLATKFGDHLA